MTTDTSRHPMAKYLRPGAEVTTFCPGCGDGVIAHSVLRALDDEGADLDDYVFVCGIGCAGWIPSPYINVDTLHTTHGRPLAFATGVKLAKPETKVVVISGDGDLTAIGGNHLIHAARRDMDLTVLCVNNRIYGMTGGQVAPTTPEGVETATTPYGAEGRPFDLCRLVEAAGATYVARWTTAQPRFITRSVKRGLAHEGFAFIEIMSQCPVQFGKMSGEGSATHMHDIMRDSSVPLKQAGGLDPAELDGKWVVGELFDANAGGRG
ncbi:MAG: 2-oxoglutarate synthase [Gemmatimonadetes bacterium]|jgi:2-oxoglutarate/2-oxoacid ferredoxin oxidoreductase subunit beta|nr:2-oxoglutarate synthase [Gemmatimonadota bacterium]MBT6149917.1 2-oxoglutarate synthase [Gemmatimonadota bacterium]MBT7860341.1 2-oxoglutarate synthase [Gemmatimonadota bacterium]